MKSKENLIGAWAFLVGVVLAIVLGLFQANLSSRAGWIYVFLAICGVLIGFLSVRDKSKEVTVFLISAMSLVIVSYMGQTTLILIGQVGITIVTILNALLTMFIPATIIVALKAVFSIASIN